VPFQPATTPGLPVVCVDWCDARDFCKWAGKRLCGQFGGGAVAFPPGDGQDPTKDEWMYACSKAGAQTYPYGSTFSGTTCVGNAYEGSPMPQSTGYPELVGSAAMCVGGYPGLFDMSGNVWEWEDSCQSSPMPQNDQCHDRGGSFWETDMNLLTCAAVGPMNHTRSYTQKNIGFRCCADAM
jgi:formylglycine-generating enzyme required for sulfatase activity